MSYYREKYDQFWGSKSDLDNFFAYERNRALPYFFKPCFEMIPPRVLDLAGGDGSISEYLKNLGYDVVLQDISKIALLKARNQRGIEEISLASVEEIPFKEELFDAVFWGDNIEHLLEPNKVLDEIYRILKKNGEVVISFPNMSYWRHRLHYIRRGMIARTEGTPNEPWEWEHIRFFNRDVILKLLNKCGFSLEMCIGVNVRKFEDKLAKKFNLFASILVVKGRKHSK